VVGNGSEALKRELWGKIDQVIGSDVDSGCFTLPLSEIEPRSYSPLLVTILNELPRFLELM
jgi:hypothetical protein